MPNDVRLQPLKDLDGYFPFTPPGLKEEWQRRAASVRRQILVAEGLWPMPAKMPLNAVIHGKIDRPDYTVEKVYFESAPGFFVTGTAGRVSWTHVGESDHGNYLEISGLGRNRTFNEELPLTWLYPKQPNGRAVIWLEGNGKAGLYAVDGTLRPEVKRLVDGGVLVVGVDLLFQGEFLADGQPIKQTRTVANPREFAGYTFAYNDALFSQRVHDVLSVLRLIRNAEGGQHRKPTTVDLVAFGEAGPIAVAARAVAGKSIDAAAIDTGGFRFGRLLDYRDPQFLPGGAKYGDLPGMLALGGSDHLWLAGETEASLGSALPKAKVPAGFVLAAQADRGVAVDWLLKK